MSANPFRLQAQKVQGQIDRMKAAEGSGRAPIMTKAECEECEIFVARRLQLADEYDAQQATPRVKPPLQRLEETYKE